MKTNNISKCEEYQQRIKNERNRICLRGISYELPLNLEQVKEQNGDLLQVQEGDSSGEREFENDDQKLSDYDIQPQSDNHSQLQNGIYSEKVIELIKKKPKVKSIIENNQNQNEMEIEAYETNKTDK